VKYVKLTLNMLDIVSRSYLLSTHCENSVQAEIQNEHTTSRSMLALP
jgi:hypothetical protein